MRNVMESSFANISFTRKNKFIMMDHENTCREENKDNIFKRLLLFGSLQIFANLLRQKATTLVWPDARRESVKKHSALAESCSLGRQKTVKTRNLLFTVTGLKIIILLLEQDQTTRYFHTSLG